MLYAGVVKLPNPSRYSKEFVKAEYSVQTYTKCILILGPNPLLVRVTGLLTGGMVGDQVYCAALACADDMSFTSDNKQILQVLVDEGGGYGGIERYLLQPVKSVIMPVPGKARKTTDSDDFSGTRRWP